MSTKLVTQPLTVEELELRDVISNVLGEYRYETFDGQVDGLTTVLEKWFESHSRQLWLEEAPWISVSERLPRDGQQVLAVAGGRIGTCTAPFFTDVTHWLELPNLPESK